MSFTLFPLPSNVKVAAPAVRLVDTKTRRSLVLNAGALEASGIAPGSPLLIEHDGHLCRVRRPAGGEPTFGTLAKAKAESCGAFSTAGRILFDAGYAAGAVGCSCGDGWVLFDAEPLLPKGETKAPAVVQPPDSAPSPAVAPAAKPPSLPAADKPWPLAIEPGIAVRVLRMVVGGSLVDAIKAELGVELKGRLRRSSARERGPHRAPEGQARRRAGRGARRDGPKVAGSL